MIILICRMRYPNDPTNNTEAHQHFVGTYQNNTLILYTISSVNGKYDRVYDKTGNVREEIYLLNGAKQRQCNLVTASFIDCSKSYRIDLDNTIDISRLTNRNIPSNIINEINININALKKLGKHTEYSINKLEFKRLNSRCVI